MASISFAADALIRILYPATLPQIANQRFERHAALGLALIKRCEIYRVLGERSQVNLRTFLHFLVLCGHYFFVAHEDFLGLALSFPKHAAKTWPQMSCPFAGYG